MLFYQLRLYVSLLLATLLSFQNYPLMSVDIDLAMIQKSKNNLPQENGVLDTARKNTGMEAVKNTIMSALTLATLTDTSNLGTQASLQFQNPNSNNVSIENYFFFHFDENDDYCIFDLLGGKYKHIDLLTFNECFLGLPKGYNCMAIKEHEPVIRDMALKKGIPVEMLTRQVIKESAGNPKALGDKRKSRGLMQIHENTATSVLKIKQTDLDKLFDPKFNLEMGTNYLLKLKNDLGPYLPSNLQEAWGMVFMSYNSGVGYMKKALKNLFNKGVTNPTLADAVKEMQDPKFGKGPIFGITIPYAQFIVGGLKSAGEAVKKPIVNIPLFLALIGGGYLLWRHYAPSRRTS